MNRTVDENLDTVSNLEKLPLKRGERHVTIARTANTNDEFCQLQLLQTSPRFLSQRANCARPRWVNQVPTCPRRVVDLRSVRAVARFLELPEPRQSIHGQKA